MEQASFQSTHGPLLQPWIIHCRAAAMGAGVRGAGQPWKTAAARYRGTRPDFLTDPGNKRLDQSQGSQLQPLWPGSSVLQVAAALHSMDRAGVLDFGGQQHCECKQPLTSDVTMR